LTDNKIDAHLKITNMQLNGLHECIEDNLSHINNFKEKQEAVVDDLNNAFETLCNELATKVQEYTMHELFYNLSQDTLLQDRLQSLICNASRASKIQLALNIITDEQLDAIKLHMKAKIKTIITVIVDNRIHNIDAVIHQGTMDQAIEDVRRCAAAQAVASKQPSMDQTQPSTLPPTGHNHIIMPHKFYRHTVTIDVSSTPQQQGNLSAFQTYEDNSEHEHSQTHPYNEDHGKEHSRSRSYNEDFGCSQTCSNNQEDDYHAEYLCQRNQYSFLKGYVKACLETLKEDDMISCGTSLSTLVLLKDQCPLDKLPTGHGRC
jgi:hypothetical protein